MSFVMPPFWARPRATPIAVRWAPVLVTASDAVIGLTEAKLHAKIGVDVTAEDSLVASWTAAAQQQVENDTGIKLLTQTWDLGADAFPAGYGWIELPFGPLQSVTSLKSYDTAGVLQTMLAGDYLADVGRIPGRIGLADAKTWPTDLRGFQPVTLRVVVGFAAIAKIPEPLLQAVRLAIAWHAANREPTLIETQSYDWLIDPYRPVVVA